MTATAPNPLPYGRPEVQNAVARFAGIAVFAREQARVMARPAERGIGNQVHYLPVHMQPYFSYYHRRYSRPYLPGAEFLYAQMLSIFPVMEAADADRVTAPLADFVAEAQENGR